MTKVNKKDTSYKKVVVDTQNDLAISYLPAVRATAYRLKERLPSFIDYNDLVSIGTEELIKITRRYDKNQNSSFWGYAHTRVYGAMLDYLRSLDVLSRSNRKIIKSIGKINDNYLATYNREATIEELSEKTGETVEKIKNAKIASEIFIVLPINDQIDFLSEDENTLDRVEQEDLILHIKNVIEELSEKEQMIMNLYYFEELTLKEISEIIDITESRISQIHRTVIKKIRDSIIFDKE